MKMLILEFKRECKPNFRMTLQTTRLLLLVIIIKCSITGFFDCKLPWI